MRVFRIPLFFWLFSRLKRVERPFSDRFSSSSVCSLSWSSNRCYVGRLSCAAAPTHSSSISWPPVVCTIIIMMRLLPSRMIGSFKRWQWRMRGHCSHTRSYRLPCGRAGRGAPRLGRTCCWRLILLFSSPARRHVEDDGMPRTKKSNRTPHKTSRARPFPDRFSSSTSDCDHARTLLSIHAYRYETSIFFVLSIEDLQPRVVIPSYLSRGQLLGLLISDFF